MAARATHRRATTPLSALLLVLQVLSGGVVPLAHAGERQTAPGTIEAHHDSSCVVIHDAMRCALCLYANSLTTPPTTPRIGIPASAPTRPASFVLVMGMGSRTHVASRPRAPPTHLS